MSKSLYESASGLTINHKIQITNYKTKPMPPNTNTHPHPEVTAQRAALCNL